MKRHCLSILHCPPPPKKMSFWLLATPIRLKVFFFHKLLPIGPHHGYGTAWKSSKMMKRTYFEVLSSEAAHTSHTFRTQQHTTTRSTTNEIDEGYMYLISLVLGKVLLPIKSSPFKILHGKHTLGTEFRNHLWNHKVRVAIQQLSANRQLTHTKTMHSEIIEMTQQLKWASTVHWTWLRPEWYHYQTMVFEWRIWNGLSEG